METPCAAAAREAKGVLAAHGQLALWGARAATALACAGATDVDADPADLARRVNPTAAATLRVWDAAYGLFDLEIEPSRATLQGHTAAVHSLLTHSGGIVSCAADGSVRRWKSHGSRECLCDVALNTGPLYQLVPAGRSVWAAAADGTIHSLDGVTLEANRPPRFHAHEGFDLFQSWHDLKGTAPPTGIHAIIYMRSQDSMWECAGSCCAGKGLRMRLKEEHVGEKAWPYPTSWRGVAETRGYELAA